MSNVEATRSLFEPLAFLEQLAALVPPPRAHLVTYHGVLAPASALRAAIVPAATRRTSVGGNLGAASRPGSARTCGRHPWAELMQRVFAVDVLRCPGCGGRRRIVAAITQGTVIRAILAALGLRTEPPAVPPARGPPDLFSAEVRPADAVAACGQRETGKTSAREAACRGDECVQAAQKAPGTGRAGAERSTLGVLFGLCS